MEHLGRRQKSDWTERSEYWLQQTVSQGRNRNIRKRQHKPIILNGDGVHLRIEKGTLHIRNGFTHHPQEPETYRFFRGDLDLPSRIIAIDCSGGLSFDVLAWLSEQGVSLICADWKGDAFSVLSCNGYTADPAKVCWQRETRANETARLAFAADVIRRKLAASVAMLEAHIAPSELQAAAIAKARSGMSRLSDEKVADVNGIFAIEGECAAAYFTAWQGVEIAWKGIKRHPIPDGWLSYRNRSSLATGVKPENRNASHPVNAMLNYAYAVKSAQLQVQAVAEGYDPTIGIMHNGRREKSAYILDVIEPERPKVDATILKLIAGHTFSGADFIIREDGGCRLSPQLSRHVATLVG